MSHPLPTTSPRPPELAGEALTCGWRLLDAASWVAPREQASSPGGGPDCGPSEGAPSSLGRGTLFRVDCILICWGQRFIGELLVVCRSCQNQAGGRETGVAGHGLSCPRLQPKVSGTSHPWPGWAWARQAGAEGGEMPSPLSARGLPWSGPVSHRSPPSPEGFQAIPHPGCSSHNL